MIGTEQPGSSAAGSADADQPTVRAPQQVHALPTGQLLLGTIIPTLLVAGIWSAAIALNPEWRLPQFLSGLAGIALMLVIAGGGVLIMSPWKSRTIEEWMTMWLAATVFRILAAPAMAFLLYSAASSSLVAKPFGLAIALTYLATLFAEAAILARHMKAVSDRQSAIGHSHRPDAV